MLNFGHNQKRGRRLGRTRLKPIKKRGKTTVLSKAERRNQSSTQGQKKDRNRKYRRDGGRRNRSTVHKTKLTTNTTGTIDKSRSPKAKSIRSANHQASLSRAPYDGKEEELRKQTCKKPKRNPRESEHLFFSASSTGRSRQL